MKWFGLLLILLAIWLLVNTATGNLQQLIANKAGWSFSTNSQSHTSGTPPSQQTGPNAYPAGSANVNPPSGLTNQ